MSKSYNCIVCNGDDHDYIDCPVLKKSDEEYKIFIKEYKRNHKACPECGCTHTEQTLAGYTYISSNVYKDENDAKCIACGWRGIVHNLKPEAMSKSYSSEREKLLIDAYEKLNDALIIFNHLLEKATFTESPDDLYDSAILLTDRSAELIYQYETIVNETNNNTEAGSSGEDR